MAKTVQTLVTGCDQVLDDPANAAIAPTISTCREILQQELANIGQCSAPTVQQPQQRQQPQGKLRRRSRRRETVEVPEVATHCLNTAPERLTVRKPRVIMMGESGVGKTTIVNSYKYGPSPDGLAITGHGPRAIIAVTCTNFDLTIQNNVPIQLHLWDMVGQEHFRSLVLMYMRNNPSAAIMVYDITDRASFEQINQWHAEITRCPPSVVKDLILVLIGNKLDQHGDREVAEAEGRAKAQRLNAMFYEITAIDAEVIRAIFESVAEQIVRKCVDVDSAWEAYEAISAGGVEAQNATETTRAGKSYCTIQ